MCIGCGWMKENNRILTCRIDKRIDWLLDHLNESNITLNYLFNIMDVN